MAFTRRKRCRRHERNDAFCSPPPSSLAVTLHDARRRIVVQKHGLGEHAAAREGRRVLVGPASHPPRRLRAPPLHRHRLRRRGEIRRRNLRRPRRLQRDGPDDIPDRERGVRPDARGRARHRGTRHRVPDDGQLRVPRAQARSPTRHGPARHRTLRRRPTRPRRTLPVRRRRHGSPLPGAARHHGARVDAVRERRVHQPMGPRRVLRRRERLLF